MAATRLHGCDPPAANATPSAEDHPAYAPLRRSYQVRRAGGRVHCERPRSQPDRVGETSRCISLVPGFLTESREVATVRRPRIDRHNGVYRGPNDSQFPRRRSSRRPAPLQRNVRPRAASVALGAGAKRMPGSPHPPHAPRAAQRDRCACSQAPRRRRAPRGKD